MKARLNIAKSRIDEIRNVEINDCLQNPPLLKI